MVLHAGMDMKATLAGKHPWLLYALAPVKAVLAGSTQSWLLSISLCADVALAGLLVVLHAGMDMKATLAGKHPWLLYALAPAMRPRMLLTLDEEGKLLSCPVRVGQAVDVVAQVRPRSCGAPDLCVA